MQFAQNSQTDIQMHITTDKKPTKLTGWQSQISINVFILIRNILKNIKKNSLIIRPFFE